MIPRVLVIAGSDSGGGAGIQADLKTITLLGGYACTAITALTAQNTLGVFGVHPVEPSFVVDQIRAVFDDIGADAVKVGMLHSSAVIEAVAKELSSRATSLPIVLDPVMVAKGGAPLLDARARTALVRELFPLAALVTPNVPEAAALVGHEAQHPDELPEVAEQVLALGPAAVLVKGGHLPGDSMVDVLRTLDGIEQRFESARVVTRSSHGTGCTLASAIATGIAEGMTLVSAIERAKHFVVRALSTAPGIGQGHGPLNHAFAITHRDQEN